MGPDSGGSGSGVGARFGLLPLGLASFQVLGRLRYPVRVFAIRAVQEQMSGLSCFSGGADWRALAASAAALLNGFSCSFLLLQLDLLCSDRKDLVCNLVVSALYGPARRCQSDGRSN